MIWSIVLVLQGIKVYYCKLLILMTYDEIYLFSWLEIPVPWFFFQCIGNKECDLRWAGGGAEAGQPNNWTTNNRATTIVVAHMKTRVCQIQVSGVAQSPRPLSRTHTLPLPPLCPTIAADSRAQKSNVKKWNQEKLKMFLKPGTQAILADRGWCFSTMTEGGGSRGGNNIRSHTHTLIHSHTHTHTAALNWQYTKLSKAATEIGEGVAKVCEIYARALWLKYFFKHPQRLKDFGTLSLEQHHGPLKCTTKR